MGQAMQGFAALPCCAPLPLVAPFLSFSQKPAAPARPRQRRLLRSGAGSPLLPLVAPEYRPRPRCALQPRPGLPPFIGCWPNRQGPVPPAECWSRRTAGSFL